MGCDEVRDLLALYAGGESYDHERAAVEIHVGVCAACARELDQYREARANLALLREGDAPPGTFKTIWAGVRAERFPARPARSPAWLDPALRYAAVAMVGVAIGVVAHFAQRKTVAADPGYATVAAPVLIPAPVQPATMPHVIVPHRKPGAAGLELDGTYYLPRVESLPAGREKDY